MASPSYTYTLANATTADADKVMQNFNDILNGVSDGTKDLSISALTVAGTATFNGAVTLGNASTDDLTVTGSLASSIPVKTASTYDIGTAALTMRAIYNDNFLGAINAVGDPTFAFHADTDTGMYQSADGLLNFATAGVERLELGAAATIFNEDGIDTDFRIESDTNANMFFVDASTNRIGIGTATPATILEISDTTAGPTLTMSGGNNSCAINLTNDGAAHTITSVRSSGDLVFGGGTGILGATITSWASSSTQDVGFSVTTGAGFFQKFTSSRRFKDDIKDLSFDTSNVYKLRAREFVWKSNGFKDFGFIAEEVEEFLPEAVNYEVDENGLVLDEQKKPIPNSVKYRQLTAVLLTEMTKLRERVIKLEGKLVE